MLTNMRGTLLQVSARTLVTGISLRAFPISAGTRHSRQRQAQQEVKISNPKHPENKNERRTLRSTPVSASHGVIRPWEARDLVAAVLAKNHRGAGLGASTLVPNAGRTSTRLAMLASLRAKAGSGALKRALEGRCHVGTLAPSRSARRKKLRLAGMGPLSQSGAEKEGGTPSGSRSLSRSRYPLLRARCYCACHTRSAALGCPTIRCRIIRGASTPPRAHTFPRTIQPDSLRWNSMKLSELRSINPLLIKTSANRDGEAPVPKNKDGGTPVL